MNASVQSPYLFKASGAFACFRRPEFASDFVTYDVITPLAAQRMIAKTFPSDCRWSVDGIMVLRQIRHEWRIDGAQRAQVLRDVAYVISATAWHSSEADPFSIKHITTKPQQTFLGLREYEGEIALLSLAEAQQSSDLAGTGKVDLGWMLYDVHGRGRARARYIRPMMIDGVIDVAAAARSQLAA